MNKFYKCKKGFTLIELLVVIGILAVLTTIAIPTVTGLIDKANASADATNANEMTNAVERFVSEYQLYKQDIASGKIKNASNFDGAQGRVYSVTLATTRNDIEKLESEEGLNGRVIDKKTKYPENVETARAIMLAYTNISSQFTPKQTDAHYYYSPDCGFVVSSNKNDVDKLNDLVLSGNNASGETLDANTIWLDLTEGDFASDGKEFYTLQEIETDPHIYAIGATKPEWVVAKFNKTYTSVTIFANGPDSNGVMEGYGADRPLSPMCQHASTLKSVVIKEGVKNISDGFGGYYAFGNCIKLTSVSLPNSLTNIGAGAFTGCTSLSNINFPEKLTHIEEWAFRGCTSLKTINFPQNLFLIDKHAFENCTNLTSISLYSTDFVLQNAFYGCIRLSEIRFAYPDAIGEGAFKGIANPSVIICKNEEEVEDFPDNAYDSNRTTIVSET